jgi:hypothetical protein
MSSEEGRSVSVGIQETQVNCDRLGPVVTIFHEWDAKLSKCIQICRCYILLNVFSYTSLTAPTSSGIKSYVISYQTRSRERSHNDDVINWQF